MLKSIRIYTCIRKHFLKISALSLAGLLIADFTKAGDKKNHTHSNA